jgi:anti-anti-sigma factor
MGLEHTKKMGSIYLTFHIREMENKVLYIQVKGSLSLENLAGVESGVVALVEETESQTVIIDLADVTYVSSTGVGLLVSFEKYLDIHHKKLYIIQMPTTVIEIFKLLGFYHFLKIYSTLQEALAHIERTN